MIMTYMKKQLFLVSILLVLLSSCSLDDGTADFYLEVMPITSVEVPDHFVLGETYEINITYMRPNSCYVFNDFIYDINEQERTVVVVNTVYNTLCTGEPEDVTVNFTFPVNGTETYVFKFYQGEDENGEDQYFLVEIPVMDE